MIEQYQSDDNAQRPYSGLQHRTSAEFQSGMSAPPTLRARQMSFRVSERWACRVIPEHRSTLHCHSVAPDQMALRMRLRDLAAARVRYDYCRLHILLQYECWPVNHHRLNLLYHLEGLLLRLKYRKKRPSHLSGWHQPRVRRMSPESRFYH